MTILEMLDPRHTPPLHPLLVNFTAALIPTSVISDWLGKFTKKDSFRSTAFWTLTLATAITPVTAYMGWRWMNALQETQTNAMVFHRIMGFSLAGILLPMLYWRFRTFRGGRPTSILYLLIMTVVILAVAMQGHIGATMTFGNGSTAP